MVTSWWNHVKPKGSWWCKRLNGCHKCLKSLHVKKGCNVVTWYWQFLGCNHFDRKHGLVWLSQHRVCSFQNGSKHNLLSIFVTFSSVFFPTFDPFLRPSLFASKTNSQQKWRARPTSNCPLANLRFVELFGSAPIVLEFTWTLKSGPRVNDTVHNVDHQHGWLRSITNAAQLFLDILAILPSTCAAFLTQSLILRFTFISYIPHTDLAFSNPTCQKVHKVANFPNQIEGLDPRLGTWHRMSGTMAGRKTMEIKPTNASPWCSEWN